jgi:hypothetical protein
MLTVPHQCMHFMGVIGLAEAAEDANTPKNKKI